MYCLFLQSLLSDLIEENEKFQGLLQVGVILKQFWRIKIRQQWARRVLL